MSEHRDRQVGTDDDSLLSRWYAASSLAEPIPPAELLERGERAHRARRKRRNLFVATVAVVAVLAGIAGVGAWANFRAVSGPGATSSPVATASATGTTTDRKSVV